jgi:hypothetical protein
VPTSSGRPIEPGSHMFIGRPCSQSAFSLAIPPKKS